MPDTLDQRAVDYARIEQAIHFIERNVRAQPDLKEIAANVGLSEYHFQRLFTRWAGISPKQFLQFLSLNYAKQQLAESKSLLDVTYETGLSSPGRLHDLFVTYEAVTPGEFKKHGAGVTIAYGFQSTPFGEALVGVTERGICALSFVERRAQALADLQKEWPRADIVADPARIRPLGEQIFAASPDGQAPPPLRLYVKGTNFQIKVWQALLTIPPGSVAAYGTIARMIDHPNAVRAIGQAIGRNPIGFLIPCHRVIRQAGALGGYRWGTARKQAILGWEAARRYQAA